MTRITLAELLKRLVIDHAPTEVENEELGALNTPLSNVLVRGTGEPTAVDKGGWLKLFEQAYPSSRKMAGRISDTIVDSLRSEQRTPSHGLGCLMQKVPKNLIVLEAQEHPENVSQRKSSGLRENADKGGDILGFPDRVQLPDDTFESLSSNDIEQAAVEKPGVQEFRAAAAPGGKEKSRVLPQASEIKRPLGEIKGAKGKCSFFALGDMVFVEFDKGQAPTRILLRETYALSLEVDADGHYEIVGIKETDVAQFLALRRKPRW